ncbi:hypothetical protein BST61_g10238 [Cercospora zeina]
MSACRARNAEWQAALRQKGSTWEPIRKEFGQRQSVAAAPPNVAGRRVERTPTPRGSSGRDSPARRAAATPPTTDTFDALSPALGPTRPPASPPPALPSPMSMASDGSLNASSKSSGETQRPLRSHRPESLRKDSAVTSMEIKITPPRLESVSSGDDEDEEENTDVTPPHTPIKDIPHRPAPPIPHKSSLNGLHDLQRALPPYTGARNRASIFHPNLKVDVRRSGIDVFDYRAPEPSPPPVSSRASQPPPPTGQAKAVHFSAAIASRRLSSGEKEHGPGEEGEPGKTLWTMIDSLNPL